MPLLARIAALMLAVVLIFASAQFDLFHSLDRRLEDVRFATASRPASGGIVMVDIDSASLSELGIWPWPRSIHAQLLDALMKLDAAEVVFDIDFSTASTPSEDAAFASALDRSGGYAMLAAFQQQVQPGGAVTTLSALPAFRAFADSVSVNVVSNQWSEITSVRGIVGGDQKIPTVAAALNPRVPIEAEPLSIDYRIDLATIDRISARDVLARRVDPARIDGKQVVVGASAIELHDLFEVPRFEQVPGALIQIAGAETLRNRSALTSVNGWPMALIGVVAAGAFLLLTVSLPLGALVTTALVAMLAIEAVSYPALLISNLLIPTATLHVAIAAAAVFRLADALALRQAEKRRQEKQLLYLAHHDVLTDTLNRQPLVEAIDRSLAEGSVTLIAVAVERIGIVNKALGHDVGDRLLGEVAARLKLAHPIAIGRTGGSVLALLLPGETDETALRETIAGLTSALDAPYLVEGHTALVSMRFGTASGNANTNGGQLLRFADIALAQAAATKVRHARFTADMQAGITERQLLDVAMRRSLKDQDFFLVYQPQVSLATGEIVGVEALVRWQHPELGVISPATFIPLAEETGAIVELGEYLLQRACREAVTWNWSGTLAVNVSAVQFRLGDVVGAVQRALTTSGLPAQRLDIEITESLFVDGAGPVLDALDALREMGVGIAMDDFGTGYSSLSYLTRLPIDKLKIDQSFVRKLPGDLDSAVIVETIISMAEKLGKDTVAEGIETVAQHELLARLGCAIGQGYLFSKPRLLPDIPAFLDSRHPSIRHQS